MSEEPIEKRYTEVMNGVAKALDELFNPSGNSSTGFVLLCYKHGNIEEGRINYISNSQRGDVIEAMESFILQAKGEKD